MLKKCILCVKLCIVFVTYCLQNAFNKKNNSTSHCKAGYIREIK